MRAKRQNRQNLPTFRLTERVVVVSGVLGTGIHGLGRGPS